MLTKETETLKTTKVSGAEELDKWGKELLGNSENRADHMEERINELKHGNLEATQVEEKVDPPQRGC